MSAITDRSAAEEVVRSLPLLAHLPEHKLRSFLSSFSLVTFEPGSFLCRKGTPSPGLLVLVQGIACIYVDNTAENVPSAQSTHSIPSPLKNRDRNANVFAAGSHLTEQLHPLPPLQPEPQSQPPPQPQSQSQPQSKLQSESQPDTSIQCSLDDDLGSAAAVAEGTPDPRQGFSDSRPPPGAAYSDKATDTVTGAARDSANDAADAGTSRVTGAVEGSTSESGNGLSYTLRPGDCFGHPTSASEAPILFVDVVASSQVTCAFFPQPAASACPASTAAASLTILKSTDSPGFSAVQQRTPPLRHPLYFVPSPEELNFILAGKLEQILHLQVLESPDPQNSTNSAHILSQGQSPSSGLGYSAGTADAFQGTTPREMFGYPRIFGGQLIGQALMAATRTVSPSFLAHSLHCYFLRPGDTGAPVVYCVERLRDGASFSSRRVKAYQGTREIFLFTASFHKPEPGLSSAVRPRPGIPRPEDLLMVEEEEWRLRTTPCLPMVMRRRLARHQVRPMPVELRHCESVERLAVAQLLREFPHPKAASASASASLSAPFSQKERASTQDQDQDGDEDKGPRFKPELNAWIRARGLSEAACNDPRLHRCIIGYFSDFVLLGTSLAAHGLFPANPRKFNMASLDHAMWFHEECRADEWLLYSLSSPWTGHARGMSLGRMFTREGRLVVSTAQEGLIRPLDPAPSVPSKL